MTEEEAKAAQEIAKAASQGINALEKTGGYLSKYIDGPLEQAVGIVEDRLKYYRWERKIRECSQSYLAERLKRLA